MKNVILLIVMLIGCLSFSIEVNKKNEEEIKKVLVYFHDAVLSGNDETILKAFKQKTPDHEMLILLLGKEDADLLFPLLKKALEQEGQGLLKEKGQFIGHGKIKEIKLTNIWSSPKASLYEDVVKDKNLPLYEGYIQCEQGGYLGGPYLIINKKVVEFKNLYSIKRVISNLKKRCENNNREKSTSSQASEGLANISKEIKKNTIEDFSKSVIRWLRSDKPQNDSENIFATPKDIEWGMLKSPNIKKRAADEIEIAIKRMMKSRFFSHKSCNQVTFANDLKLKDLNYKSFEHKITKKNGIEYFKIIIFLEHKSVNKKLGISVNALALNKKLKIVKPFLIMPVHFGGQDD